MAGTKTAAEALQSFRVSTILSASSTPQNSLEGLDPRMLTDKALVWVDENSSVYRWDDASTATANASTIVAAAVGGTGRWFQVATNDAQGLPLESYFNWFALAPGTTTISGSGVVTPLNANSFFALGAPRDTDFTLNASTGVVTYNGNKNYIGMVQLMGAVDVAGAGNQDIKAFVDTNGAGADLTDIPSVRAVSGRAFFNVFDEIVIANGNTYQIVVMNLTDDEDISLVAGAVQPVANIRDVGLPL